MDSPDAMPPFLGKQLLLSFNPFRGTVRAFSKQTTLAYYALCRLLPRGQRQLLSAQPISLAREIPGHKADLPG